MENTHAFPGADAQESEQLDNGLISLNAAAVVDCIIRDFTREVIGLIGSGDFMARLDFECRRMNSLFLGITQTDKYRRGPWNAPDQMGEYVQKALLINGTTRLAVRDAFMLYVDQLLDSIDPGAPFDESVIEPMIGELATRCSGGMRVRVSRRYSRAIATNTTCSPPPSGRQISPQQKVNL
jgi:hypothetical protein